MKKYLRKHLLAFILVIIFSSLTSVIRIITPLIVGKAIDVMIEAGKVDFLKLSQYIQWLIICSAAFLLSQWLSVHISNNTVFRIAKQVRDDLFSTIQKLHLSYLDSHLHGETINVIINDVEQFTDGLLLIINSLFSGIITIIGILFFMFSINAQIAWTVVLLTPLSLLIAQFIARNTHDLFARQSALKAAQSGMADEFINQMKRIKAFNYQAQAQQRFNQLSSELVSCSTKAIFFSSLVNPSTRLINNIIYAITGFQGALMCLSSSGFTIGSLSVFLSYASEFGKPFNDISSVLSELQSCQASAQRIEAILNSPVIADDQQKPELPLKKSLISFRDVCFSYDKKKPVIQNLSLDIKDGEKIALVGTTGCGKTTLINLLLRFYDIDSGSISIDGHDIYSVRCSSLRDCFGMVLQDSWVKQATIRDNLTIGNPQASQQQIEEICRITHCDRFIEKMKHKYDTYISDENSLSAGQKQLLSIARVMLSQPRILILDEATSNIDTRTEIDVQKALEALMENRTSLIVAHRLSTIVNSDRIIVMDQGQIVEQGRHEELLKKKGAYYTLYNSQFRHPSI